MDNPPSRPAFQPVVTVHDLTGRDVLAHLASLDARLARGYRYWELRCSEDMPPRRAEIDALDLRHLLPHIVLMSVTPDRADFLHSLVGQHIADQYGRPLRGVLMGDLVSANPTIKPIFDAMQRCITLARPELSEQVFLGDYGTRKHNYAMMLPLRGAGNSIDHILSIGVYLDRAA